LSSTEAPTSAFQAAAPKGHFLLSPSGWRTRSVFIRQSILLNMFDLALKQLVEPSKLEHTCRFFHKVGGVDGIDLIEHGVVVDGKLFINIEEEIVGNVRFTDCMVVDDCIFFA
jgi:hypothetical protein